MSSDPSYKIGTQSGNIRLIRKLTNIINNPGSTAGEIANAQMFLDKLKGGINLPGV